MYRVAIGNPSPAVGFFSGVPGVERIGSDVVLSHLRSVATRLRWDETLHNQLATMRMVFMPIINPGGLSLGTRAG
ncbi:hypothetical protein [Thauera sp. 2A1]|uniref:hypothetical protein n=1 Tax=Thauera sp. 2A1 TaxID=2570191 RepID=UPI0012915194|nr:hypothetical protein [Thauera sp. 2A1]KAI5915650.1 hypothetical protein GH664_06820 [Thauera sp. 2A1]